MFVRDGIFLSIQDIPLIMQRLLAHSLLLLGSHSLWTLLSLSVGPSGEIEMISFSRTLIPIYIDARNY
jgi:hypothetical protein